MDVPRHEQEEAVAVTSARAGNLWIIAVSGDVDYSNTDPVEVAVAESLRTHDGPVAFDLSELTFCDSSMLNVLLRTSTQRSRVLLIGVRAQAQRLLDITGTAALFEQYATVQDAAGTTS